MNFCLFAENKRNDVPQPVGGLGSTENWDEEDNFNASEVPSTPHVPPNSRFGKIIFN